ncbi:MAG: uroporphyrinogen decarboxylase family protein [Anaerolineae bacterium]
MNSKERVRLAFARQEADRVPTLELTIDNPTAAHVLGRPNLCGFGGRVRGLLQNQALIEGTFVDYHRQRVADEIELWQALDLDVYCQAAPIAREPIVPEQLDGVTWRFADPATGHWTVTRYAPESQAYDYVDSSLRQGGLAELARLTGALEAQEPTLDDWDFGPVEAVLEGLGRDRFVLGHADVELGSTMDWAETFLVGLIKAPDLIHRFLDVNLKAVLLRTEALLERGVDGVWGGVDWAANRGPIFSPRHFRQFVFPRLKQIVDLCHRYGVPYIKHTDGNVNSLLDDLVAIGVDAFHAIEPRAGMDIVQLKQDYGQQLVLIGNVDCASVLVDGPESAVRVQTEAIIRAVAPGGGFILSSSNSIHPGVQPEYYLAMLDTARQVGRYPIA